MADDLLRNYRPGTPLAKTNVGRIVFMVIAGNVWFGGNAPIGVALHIHFAENEEISDGRIEGLSADQLAWFGQCAARNLDVDGKRYEVRVAKGGTLMATRRIN